MLHEFLTTHRAELIGRCRAKVAQRVAPRRTPTEQEHGLPLFLDQLVRTLQANEAAEAPDRGEIEIGATATRHGRELSEQGYTVDQVVRDYGDLCQAVTELAIEKRARIGVDEFRTLNRCLDNAIADAVREFSYQRTSVLTGEGDKVLDERLRVLAHELRDHIQAATLAVTAIKDGSVGLTGATATILDRSLVSLRSAIDRSLADAWATAGSPPRHDIMSVADFVAEVRSSVAFEARTRGCTLSVAEVEKGLAVDADRDLLLAAVRQLLQNAFTFTQRRTDVTLTACPAGDRVLIEIADHCGGLSPGAAETMFLRSDPGLGLSICRRCVEASHGILTVRNVPGKGCVFTIDLPRRSPQ